MKTYFQEGVAGMPRSTYSEAREIPLRSNLTGALAGQWMAKAARVLTTKEVGPVIPRPQVEVPRQHVPRPRNHAPLSRFLQRIRRFSNACVAGSYVEIDKQCQKAIVKFRCKSTSMLCGVSAQWPMGECKEEWSVLGCSGRKFVSGCACYVN